MHLNINKRSRGRVAAAVSASAVLGVGCRGLRLRRFDVIRRRSPAATSAARSASSPTRLLRRSTRRRLGPDFQAGDGSEVELAYSFGSSGDQSRAVEAGAPADVVHLPLEPDMTRLVDAGARRRGYRDVGEYDGSPQTSVVAFTVRGGNPKDIQDWDDLDPRRRLGDHAEPVHLGRRALEHHGRLRPGASRTAAPRRRRCSSSSDVLDQHGRPGRERVRRPGDVRLR